MKTLKIKDIMTPNPSMIAPAKTVKEAASRMKEIDCGILPVGDADKVLGMITDRDITLRVTAEGKDPTKTLVRDVMSRNVYSCEEDEGIAEAAEEMRKYGVARLVVTKNKKATGIVTMKCLLQNKGDRAQSDAALHALLGPKKATSSKTKEMASAGGSCGSCE
jgi:CBS domain-containing protein